MNDPWKQFSPYWLQTAVPFGIDPKPPAPPSPGGGLFSSLSRSLDQSSPTWSGSETPAGRGILGLLVPPADSQPASDPYWPQTAMPLYPWLRTAAPLPWPPSMLPIPPVFPSTFPPIPPLAHLDSAKYWGAAPAPSGASEPPPANRFYLSPVPQAPSWDQTPTRAADSTAQIFPQPPSPSDWGTSATGMGAVGSSPNYEFADANGGMLGLLKPPAAQPWNIPRPGQSPPAMWDPSTLPIPPVPPSMFPSMSPNANWNESNPSLRQLPAGANAAFPAPPTAPELDPATAQYLRALDSNPATQDYGRQPFDAMIASQQVVPGEPDDGQWTNAGRGGNDPRIISDATPDNDWKSGAQYANGRRSGSVPVRIGGQWIEMELGQANRLFEAQTRAQAATARARELDPNWRPTPSIQKNVEVAIRAHEAEVERAEARIRELTRFQTSPIIPRQRPAAARERNDVAREIARWLVKNQGHVVEGANWLFEYEPAVQAYLDPPKSLEELQQAVLAPKKGYDIHHIVEQTSAEQDRFPRSMIDAPDNLVHIPKFKHWEINGWYGRLNDSYGGLSPREYLRGAD